MKKLLALLMAVVMIFALAACGDDTDKDDDGKKKASNDGVEGEWVAEYVVDAEELGMDDYDVSMTLYFDLSIDKDTYELTINESKTKDSLADYMRDVCAIQWEELAEEFGEDIEDYFGMNYDEYMETYCSEDAINEMLEEVEQTQSGEYELKDGKITLFSEDEDIDDMEGELDGDELVFDGEPMELENDLIFERA